jgi:invasion protein IalB
MKSLTFLTAAALTFRTTCLAVAAAIATIGVLGASGAQAQSSNEGWSKSCSNINGTEICTTQIALLTGGRQLITGVGLVESRGNSNQRLIQIVVPTGRLIAPGISMSIDGGQSLKIDYEFCLPDRCHAQAPLTDDLIDAFRRGSTVTVTVTDFRSNTGSSSLSLAGFAAAYDSSPVAPITRTAIEQLLKDREAAAQAALDAARQANGE